MNFVSDLAASKPFPKLLRGLWQHVESKRRFQCSLVFLVMILASFAEVLSIGAVLPFLGAITNPESVFTHSLAQPLIKALELNNPEELLLPLTIIFSCAAVFAGVMRLVLLWSQTRLSFAIGADLSFSIYRRTLYQPYARHIARNSSELITGISAKASSVVGNALIPVATILSSVLMIGSIMVALLSINPIIAMSAFVGFSAIYVGIVLITRKSLAKDSQRVAHESTQVIKALQEGLGGIRDVIVDGSQEVFSSIYRSADLPLRRSAANITIISTFPRYGIEALGMVLISILAYTMVSEAESLNNVIPVLGALALGAQRLLPVLQQAYGQWTAIRGGQVALEEVLELLEQPLPCYAEQLSRERSPIPFEHSINLNNLRFRYSDGSPWVLSPGINLTIPKGSRVGFIGVTGSGKSTILDIIMALLVPSSGELKIDGVVIGDENLRDWQAHIAHVPQSVFLTDSTIAENIAFGIPVSQIDYERVHQAAEKAQIAETIEGWSEKYNSLVGEQGVRLSGGQRQRIGIARALYKQADVVILDEATSALDNDTERVVMDAIRCLGDEITVIIVAHRLTTLKNCSQIIELKDGQISRAGSYREIIG
jgi:ATP-binding cassette, subfamily B, bacterial PglK